MTATEGNVKGPRPGILNMLERSKYDAWVTMKDIPTSEAKFLYCESLKKILKKYSDKPISLELLSKLRKPLDEGQLYVLIDYVYLNLSFRL